MEVNRDLVESIARLARLELTEAEIGLFVRQLGEILHYFEKISDLETAPVRESLPDSSQSPTRSDSLEESLSPEAAMQNAPKRSGNFFKVPRVIP